MSEAGRFLEVRTDCNSARLPVPKLIGLALSIGLLLPHASAGGKGGQRCAPPAVQAPTGGACVIPVTTVIGDLDSNGLPADIASDGRGAYAHGVAGVTSWLTSNVYNGLTYGDWQFDAYDSTTRLVNESLEADDVILPGDPHYTAPANPPFWGTQALKAHIEVKCTLVLNNMLTMTPGTSFTCPLINRFNAAGNIDYRLAPAFSWSHFPETSDAQVRCNTADTVGCNDWFIDPISLGQAVGRLVPVNSGADDGDFYMRFHIHITRP